MKNENMTDREFLQKFDSYRRTPNKTVIIHPGLTYNFIELSEEFVQQLKNDIHKKIILTKSGIDEPNALESFALMLLKDSF